MNQSEFSSKSNCNISSLYLQRYKGYYDDTKENNNTQNKNEVINYLNKYKNKDMSSSAKKKKSHHRMIQNVSSIKRDDFSKGKYILFYDNKSTFSSNTKSISPIRPVLKNEGYSLKPQKGSSRKKYSQTNHYHLNIVNNNIYCNSTSSKTSSVLNTMINKTVQIQSMFRGYELRKKFFRNINIVFSMNYAINLLHDIVKRNLINNHWSKIFNEMKKRNEKKIVNMNSHMNKIDQMLNESLSMFIKRKENVNLFSFINLSDDEREKRKKVHQLNLIKTFLSKCLNIKTKQILKIYFRNFLVLGFYNTFIEEKEKSKEKYINHLRHKTLLKLLDGKTSSNRKLLQRSFIKFIFQGLLYQNELLKKEKEIAEEKLRLQRMLQEKEAERIKTLKVYFNRFYHNCITGQLQEAFKREKAKKEEQMKMYKEKKLYKIVILKETSWKRKMHNMFMKFYYGGIYRKMVQGNIDIVQIEKKNSKLINQENISEIIPQKEEVKESIQPKTEEIIKPKEEEMHKPPVINRKKARELRKLLNNKNKTNKEKLKIYFTKFYLAGLLNRIQTSVRRGTLQVSEIEQINNINEEKENRNFITKEGESIPQRMSKEEEEHIKQIQESFKKLFYQKERTLLLFIQSSFKKWNLRAKIIKLKQFNQKPKKKIKKSKKVKDNSVESVNNSTITNEEKKKETL